MGPFWAGSMTCWDCHKKWHYFHSKELIVDWRGLGRPRKVKCRMGVDPAQPGGDKTVRSDVKIGK